MTANLADAVNLTPIRSAAADTVDRLTAERDGLPDAIAHARRTGDANEAVRLEQRRDDIAADIDAARRHLDLVDLEAAWREAEDLHRQLPDLDAARRNAADQLRGTPARAPAGATGEQRAEHTLAVERLRSAKTAADETRDDALRALQLALIRVDDLERRTGTVTTGDGLRAPARPLKLTAHVADPRGSEHRELATTVTFAKGDIPPRWAALVMGDHMFDGLPDTSPAHGQWHGAEETTDSDRTADHLADADSVHPGRVLLAHTPDQMTPGLMRQLEADQAIVTSNARLRAAAIARAGIDNRA